MIMKEETLITCKYMFCVLYPNFPVCVRKVKCIRNQKRRLFQCVSVQEACVLFCVYAQIRIVHQQPEQVCVLITLL